MATTGEKGGGKESDDSPVGALETEVSEESTLCGLWGWRPECLRGMATSRTFLVVYGLLGTIQAMAFVYFISTLTTLEKRFKIPSRTSGFMMSGNEVSQIMLSLFLTYYGGHGRRPLWIAWGVALSALSCFILTLPHFVFGAGPEAVALTEEYLQHRHFNYTVSQSEAAKLCSWVHPPDPDCPLPDEVDLAYTWLPAGLVFLSQFVLGIGTTLYFSLGQTYLDDNTKKANTPMLLGLTMALRTVGPAVGFMLGSACLSLYIDPSLTPVITRRDPRWLGAWWLGWILLGTAMFMFAGLMAMFPRHLPKKNLSENLKMATLQDLKSTKEKAKDEYPLTTGKSFHVEPLPAKPNGRPIERPTLKAFPAALMRLLKNKLLICNIWSAIFYILGGSAYITFITKYLEVQFHQSAAQASMVTAPISILAMMTGFLVSGFAISRWKPRPVYLLGWNVIVGMTYVLAEISFIFLGCPEVSLQGYRQDYNGRVELTMPCNSNCGCQNIKYDPVCYEPLGLTFYSACHAGCTSSIIQNDIKMYDNCTCVSGREGWRGPGHGSGDPSHHHQYYSVSSGYTPGYNNNPGGYNNNPGDYNNNPGGYSNNPGGSNNNPGSYNNNPGSYNNPGGYNNNPGSYKNNPGSYNNNPGSYNNNPVSYNNNPVSYNNNPVSYNNNPVSYNNNPGGYNNNPGSYNNNPVSYNNNPRGYNNNPGSYNNNPGGYNNNPGGYNNNPGGYNNPSGYNNPGAYNNPGGNDRQWTPWPQLSDQSVRAGPCELDCKNVFLIFICVTTVMHSLGSSGKVGNILVNYRAVDPKDKDFAQGLGLFLISIFAFIPGPILFGAIIDSTCLVWDDSCGRKGNCWLYDQHSFRVYLNSTAAAITSIGVLLDAVVCYLGRNLELYVDDDTSKSQEITPSPEDLTPPQTYTSIAV